MLRMWACLPAVLLCGALLAAIGVSSPAWRVAGAVGWAGHALPVAACATLAALIPAAAPAATGTRGAWLVPWLAAAACVAAWPLLPVPRGATGEVARDTILVLPVAVLALRSAWSALPAGLWRTAAAAGASPSVRVALHLRLALPGAVWASMIVGALCLGLTAWRPA